MKHCNALFFFFPVLFLAISCNTKQKSEADETKEAESETVQFVAIPHTNQAIVLTQTLMLYNSQRQMIGSAKEVYGTLVEIDSMSENKYALIESKDRCQLHHFIKIRSKSINAWVYGQFVYEFDNERICKIDSLPIKLQFIPCKNFNIGVYDELEESLSFCGGNLNPLVLFNSKFNRYEYIPVQKHEVYIEPFLTYDNHDGWEDHLRQLKLFGDTLKVTIEREHQESFEDIELEIYLDAKQSKARVVQANKREETN